MKIQKSTDAARLIKTRRLEQRLTQQTVAETVGITRQSFARIEQGHGGASLETFLKIFSTLDIALHGTPAGQESTAPTRDIERERQTPSASAYAGILRSLGDAASLAAKRDLVNSGAVANSILRMNQTSIDSLSRLDQGLLKPIGTTHNRYREETDDDANA